jgi:FkbM family methyltransferase
MSRASQDDTLGGLPAFQKYWPNGRGRPPFSFFFGRPPSSPAGQPLHGETASVINPGLAFDIGANTGQDTAALLARGLRVVAVEANPKLCADMRARFADAISDGRLVIIDKAISGRKTVTFYVNSADSGWGTTSASYAARGVALAGKLEQIEVETTTMTEIIRAHGSPL